MELYKNIRERRIELGYSQDYIAKLLGYADRSAIAKIEAGKSDLPVSKIEAFAAVLCTTAPRLMGWEAPEGYDQLGTVEKAEIKGEIKQMLKSSKKSAFSAS